jgi:hypothetical protein
MPPFPAKAFALFKKSKRDAKYRKIQVKNNQVPGSLDKRKAEDYATFCLVPVKGLCSAQNSKLDAKYSKI